MSEFANIAFVQQYTTNVELLLQQMGSRLRNAVTTGTYTGKAAKAVEQIGPVEAVRRTTRHGDTPLISTPHDARWVRPKDFEWADLIDDQDKIRMLIDPQSPYARNGAMALGRSIDREIINSFFAVSDTGEDGDVSTAFPAGQVVPLSATGLTVAKLREAKRLLMAADVDIDNEKLFVAVTAQQHDDLLGETQTVSIDFNTTRVLVDGRITAFMGFNFIHTELLLIDGNGDNRCPAWAMSGMHLGLWNDITTRISERDDKSYSTQVYVKATHGATRVEEEKVVEILCDL